MSPLAPRWIAVGAVLAAAGVALGAFGAHGLEKHLSGLGYSGDDLAHRIANHETAVRYQMWHAIAIVVVGLAIAAYPTPWWEAAAWAFLIGILIFSGLLYALVFVGPNFRWLGAIVPIGGLSLIAGWLLLAIGALWR
ncbi:MAG TPA: DUF423 domain-containing protein [Lacipirellulaceae bacterium]|jgi:uncharacterized membrane protein YgdD (TMEM256/DUF423 family)